MVKHRLVRNTIILTFFVMACQVMQNVNAQIGGNLGGYNVPIGRSGSDTSGKSSRDSLQAFERRDPHEDSIIISFRYFDSTRNIKIDSSLDDFSKRLPQPYYYQTLGNFGNAAYPLVYNPLMTIGFDPGFHSFDIYKYKIEDSRFYQTTKPYTELAYLLGSSAEQYVGLLHTQNRKPNFNFTFQYQLINSPGTLKGQSTNNNSLRFNSFYQTKNKRYTLYLILITSRIRSGENGGVADNAEVDSLALSKTFNNPYTLTTRLNNNSIYSTSPFGSVVKTGTFYKENTIYIRHSYDIGQKDSLVTDSSVIRLFYPRLRFQHTLQYNTWDNSFQDNTPVPADYYKYFSILTGPDTVQYRDVWKSLTNELAVLSYPQKNNLNQYLKLGAGFQFINGQFNSFNSITYGQSFNDNIYLLGEYRNRTRNQRWDMIAAAKLFAAGEYAGDYSAYVSLKSLVAKKLGYLELGFQTVNRTPSFIYDGRSAFPTLPSGNFNKENIIKIFANTELTSMRLKLAGEYYMVTNYAYFDSFLTAKQNSSLFNVLHLSGETMIPIIRHVNFYAEAHLQQTAGDAPLNIPLLFARGRIAFEGNFFTKLFLSTGLEIKYNTPYKANNYSPFTGQFFYQDAETISNRPEVNVFFHFRIRSFKGFIRLENLNTLNLYAPNYFRFNTFNYAAPYYPTRPLWFRVGIWWNFIN